MVLIKQIKTHKASRSETDKKKRNQFIKERRKGFDKKEDGKLN